MANKHISIALSGLILLGSALVACRQETVPVTDRGTNYYPYAPGLWWEYDVDSTWYNDFSGDTVHVEFILREVFDTFFVADDGTPAMRIERYRRTDANAAWQGPRIWWTYVTADCVVKVEENNPYVKLNFPVQAGGEWNGNRLNYMDARTYRYENVDRPLVLDAHVFDSTTSVLQIDLETLLEKQLYREKYARRVGLVDRSVIDIRGYTDSDNIPDTSVNPLMNRIKSGVVIRQKIRDWGM